jgi:hypothetical protein
VNFQRTEESLERKKAQAGTIPSPTGDSTLLPRKIHPQNLEEKPADHGGLFSFLG